MLTTKALVHSWAVLYVFKQNIFFPFKWSNIYEVPFYSFTIIHKSTIESSKHPNSEQKDNSSSTKLSSFLNST
jgi:hypothetical protein